MYCIKTFIRPGIEASKNITVTTLYTHSLYACAGGNEAVKEKIKNTNEVIQKVISIAKKLKLPTHQSELERISSALLSGKVQIGFVGLTNAGKSATVSSFIGSPFLPSTLQRQTVGSIRVVHDPTCTHGELFGTRDGLTVSLASGIYSVHSRIEELNTNDHINDIRYSELVLYAPVTLFSELEENFAPEFLDMGGSCENIPSQQAIIAQKTALKSLAAIVLVVSADDVSKTTVTDLVENLKQVHPGLMEKQSRVLVLINKYDMCYDDENKGSWGPDRIQKEMANHIGVPIEQTVCFSAKYALLAQKWLRDPSAVTQRKFFEEYFFLQSTPEKDSIAICSLEKPTQENVKKLAEGLEKFSRFQEVKTKLQWALCVNGREVLLDSAVDNGCAEVSKMEEAISHRIQEIDIRGKENKLEQQKAQTEKVEQFFQSQTLFPKTLTQFFEIQLNALVATLENDINIQSSFKVSHLKKNYDSQQQALKHVLDARKDMLQEGKEQIFKAWKYGILQMKQTLLANLKQLLQHLKEKVASENITDIFNLNGVEPLKLLETISESFESVEQQPDFSQCTAIGDDALKAAIQPCTETRQRRNEQKTTTQRFLIFPTDLGYNEVINYQVTVFEINAENLLRALHQFASFCSDHVRNSLLKVLNDVANKLSQALWDELKQLSEEPITLKEKVLQKSKKEVAELETENKLLGEAKKTLCEPPSPTGKKREFEEEDDDVITPVKKLKKPGECVIIIIGMYARDCMQQHHIYNYHIIMSLLLLFP